MNIALVHDYLREYGGAERVVEVLHEIWPEAPLYTAFIDRTSLGEHASRFDGWDIRTSWVQKNIFVKKYISPLRFLAPKIWSSFDLSQYDVVLSSSGWFMCRGVALNREKEKVLSTKYLNLSTPLHISYIHHPPRNLYGYATGSDLQKYALVRAYATVVNFFLRQYDFRAAQAVDLFIANSKETARRVEKFYRRDSTLIYPPIDIPPTTDHRPRTYFLSVGRLTWSKRIDLAIQACNDLNLPLKIVGVGKEDKFLRSIAGPTIEFAGGVSDEKLAELYAGAKALIFSALNEDFGMVPVEAMAHGTPVIGLAQGGVKETIVDGKTGFLFDSPDVESLKIAIHTFQKSKISAKNCIAQAKEFSKERFKRVIQEFVDKKTHH